MKMKFAGLLFAVALLLSCLAGLSINVEPAKAWGEYVTVPLSNQPVGTFNRVYCTFWDGLFGFPEMTARYPQRAVISNGDYLAVPMFGYTQGKLYRLIQVYNGQNWVNSGWVWLNTQQGETYWWPDYYYVSFTFYDDLYIKASEPVSSPYSGLRYYFSGSPTQFAGCVWRVKYALFITSHYIWGELADSAWFDFNFIEHDEYNYPTNWELCPECSSRVASSNPWTYTYGQASVTNPNRVLGSPDSNYAQFWAYSTNAMAMSSYYLGGFANGDIYLRLRAVSANSRMLVYASTDNNNWVLAGDINLPVSGSFTWVNFGRPSVTNYRYVLIVAYNDGKLSNVYVDCVRTGHPP